MKQALSILLILFVVLMVLQPQTVEAKGWFSRAWKAVTAPFRAAARVVATVVKSVVSVASVVIHKVGCIVGGVIDPVVPWDAKCKRPSAPPSSSSGGGTGSSPSGSFSMSPTLLANPTMNFVKDEPTNSTIATIQMLTANPAFSLSFPSPQVIQGKTLDLRPATQDIAVNSLPISGNKFNFRVWLPNKVDNGTFPFLVRITDGSAFSDVTVQLTVTSGVLKSTTGGSGLPLPTDPSTVTGTTPAGGSDELGAAFRINSADETSPVTPTFNLSVLKNPAMSFITDNPSVSSEGSIQISGSFSGSAFLNLVTNTLSDGKTSKNLSLDSSSRLNDLFKFKLRLSGKLTTKTYPVILRVTDGSAFKNISVDLRVTSVVGGQSER